MRTLILVLLLLAGSAGAATDEICLHQPTGNADPIEWTLKFDGVEETATPSDEGTLEWFDVPGEEWCVTYTIPSFSVYYTVTLWADWAGGSLPATNQNLRVYETQECRADYNNNGAVDLSDVSYANGRLGTPCPEGCRDDLNQNTAVDMGDVSATLSLLGKDC